MTEVPSSLERRMRFAGDARFFFDRVASSLPQVGGPRRHSATSLHRIPERMAALGFDLLEGIRTRGRVPSFGEPRKALDESAGPIAQHPRYLGYWYDASRHSAVGMHLGLDVIRNGGRYHFLELNLNAAIRDTRRLLYDEPLDPVVAGILESAKAWGFRRVVPYSWGWADAYTEEFERAGRELGMEVLPSAEPWRGVRPRHPLAALPLPLPPETLFVVFTSRHTPLDFFLCDKWRSARWLEGELERDPHPLLCMVPTHEQLAVPPLHADPRWPNLVFKLADWDHGRFVGLAKVRDEAEARGALGLRGNGGTPAAFGIGPGTKLVNLLSRRGKVLYQRYIPPPLDAEQRGRKHRVHMLVTPVGCEFLSAHVTRGGRPVPGDLPFGVVQNSEPYALNFRGETCYRRIDASEEVELAAVTRHLGRLLDRAVCRRFRTTPE